MAISLRIGLSTHYFVGGSLSLLGFMIRCAELLNVKVRLFLTSIPPAPHQRHEFRSSLSIGKKGSRSQSTQV
uniref:Uncharacterized protein n=1 Tax=Utricularia reniformis TaxID=192314 RepID=A0A1Y0B4L0_9LAMI|nr:hypothetical protein AEK19_MT2183 [Utricularia reniformis]ART32330.1 hypothetical protein AEK19_MT2183 [Utricularia reniformis]